MTHAIRDLPPMRVMVEGQPHDCPVEPVINSIKNLATALEIETNSAPLGKLSELYTKVLTTGQK
jgi:hypothetical protein